MAVAAAAATATVHDAAVVVFNARVGKRHCIFKSVQYCARLIFTKVVLTIPIQSSLRFCGWHTSRLPKNSYGGRKAKCWRAEIMGGGA